LTPEGFRDFEIRPAVDLQLATGSGDKSQAFTYEVVGMTEKDMTIQIVWSDPDAISSSGVSSDSIKVTFWSSDLLQGQNGLAIEEGQTLSKSVISQIEPSQAKEVEGLGRLMGAIVAGMIGGCLFLAHMLGFD